MTTTRQGALALWATLSTVAGAAGCRARTKEEVLSAEQEKARFETEKKGRALQGIGEGLQTAGKDGAQALSKGVGDVFKGTVKGFDASLAAVSVAAGPGLAESGLVIERAARQRGETPTITVYLVSERAFAGTLRLRALLEGREVGRSQARLDRAAGAAGYVDFAFDPRVPLASVSQLELVTLPGKGAES